MGLAGGGGAAGGVPVLEQAAIKTDPANSQDDHLIEKTKAGIPIIRMACLFGSVASLIQYHPASRYHLR